MARRPRHPVPAGIVDVACVLVLVEGAVAVTATLEVTVWAALGMPVGPVLVLTGGAAALTLLLAAGLGRRSRTARKLVILAQLAWIGTATVDLVLALALAQRLLEPVALLTRFVVPLAVFRILRRPAARLEFGVRLSHRQRRRAAAPASAAPEPAAELVPA